MPGVQARLLQVLARIYDTAWDRRTLLTFAGCLGGGILVRGGVVIGSRSTLYNNGAEGAGGGAAVYSGGTLSWFNSTVSHNVATSGLGAGIATLGKTTLKLTTVTANVGSGIGVGSGGTAILGGTIVADQTGVVAPPDCLVSGGTIVSEDYNLDSDGTCLSGVAMTNDVVAGSAALGAIGTWGGLALNHPVDSASDAVDLVPPGTHQCGTGITVSQNYETRPADTACEAGSHEILSEA